MLTGDKGATAKQIAKNSGLLRGEVLVVPESGNLSGLRFGTTMVQKKP